MGFNIKKKVRKVGKVAKDPIGATKDFAKDINDQIFGKEKTYDTLNQYQKDTMSQLGSDYSADVAAGVNPDYNVSGDFFTNGIQKQALNDFDTNGRRGINAQFAGNMSGTGNLMAASRGLQGLQGDLQKKRTGLDYQELLGARERLNASRQGLAGLANITTKAKIDQPGLLSGAMTGLGTAGSVMSIAKGGV